MPVLRTIRSCGVPVLPALLALLILIPLTLSTGWASEGPDKESGASAEDEASPGYIDWWGWWFPGHYKKKSLYRRRLAEPLGVGQNEFLHHLVLHPPMEGFRILRPGHASFDLHFEAVRSTRTGSGDDENRFDASFFESVSRMAYGIARNFEVRAGFNVAWFKPDGEGAVRLTQAGKAVFPPEDFDPRPNLGNLTLGLKIFSAFEPKDHLGLSTLLTLKIPVGKSDFLSSGRGDFAVTFLGTGRLGFGDGYHIYVHLNAGVVFFDEENVFPSKVYLSSCSTWGASAVLPLNADQIFLGAPFAFVLQMQGHTNVFRKLDVLNSDPVSLLGGFRVMLGNWTLEASAGFGLNKTSAPDHVFHVALGSDF